MQLSPVLLQQNVQTETTHDPLAHNCDFLGDSVGGTVQDTQPLGVDA